MKEILLLIIACCLLFGAEKTKRGIGVILKVIGIGLLILIGLSFLGSFLPDADQTSDVEQEQQEEYAVVTVEELQDAWKTDYDHAKEKYNGMNASVTGKIVLPYKDMGFSFPYITSTDESDNSTLIPILTDSDELTQQLESAENSVVTVKGAIWVANDEDFGIEEDEIDAELVDEDGHDFGIILMPESIE